MPPPGSPIKSPGGKADPTEAQVVREDAHCIDCENYSVDDGTCSKVDGQFAPQDACIKYFEPTTDSEGPDADGYSHGFSDDSVGGDQGGDGGGGAGGGMGQP